jgi:membrane protein YqaA with SNARE-associated domain
VVAFFLQFGFGGLALLAIADDSFLFLPIGSDLLTVPLVARHHEQLPICVLAAATGSTIGVLLLDLVCRKGGEEGLQRLLKPKLLRYLQQQMKQRATAALIVSCLAPPRFRLVHLSPPRAHCKIPGRVCWRWFSLPRAIRFALVGWAAIYFGQHVLRIAASSEFIWFMGGFITACLIGSYWQHRVNQPLGPH